MAEGLTLRETARRAGVGVGALSMFERGLRRPSLGTLERLVRVLGVEVHISSSAIAARRTKEQR
jgi:transcriptional regulator with XRE-family HTH domain